METGWLLVAILVPFVINLWAGQPFEPAKAAVLRTLTWAMAGLWLVDTLLRQSSLRRQVGDNPLLWPALAWAAAQIAATVLAEDKSLALWGSYERSQGAVTLLSYVLLFLVVSSRLSSWPQIRRLLAAIVAPSALLVGLGLAQGLGWRLGELVTDARSPVYATLGRSNFLGAYLAMLLPLTLALTWNAREAWQRLAGIGLIAGQGLVIVLSLARGAWLAAGTGMALFGLLYCWPRLHRGWRIVASLGLIAGLGALLGATLWLGGQGGSAAARLAIWQAVLDLIPRRPLTGYGPENLGLVFPIVYPAQLVYYQGRGIVVDRAHNLFLDRMVTTGLLGLLADLWLLAAFAAAGLGAARRTPDEKQRRVLVACLAAVAAGVAGNLVSFDVTATATATWLLLAIVAAAARQTQTVRDSSRDPNLPTASSDLCESGGPERRPSLFRWAGLILALACAVILVLATIQANVRPVAADILARTAAQRAARGDLQGAVEAGERAVALWPVEPEHHMAVSWAYLQRAATQPPSARPWLQQAEAHLLAARDSRPGDYRIWAALGELYGQWGRYWDAGKLALARTCYQQAIALAPNQAMLYTAWGMVDLESGDLAQAASRFRRAVDLDATDGYAWAHLGDVEWLMGHAEEALAAFQQAAHWQPDLVHAHLGLARSYLRMGQAEMAQSALRQALSLDPDNPEAQALEHEMNSGP